MLSVTLNLYPPFPDEVAVRWECCVWPINANPETTWVAEGGLAHSHCPAITVALGITILLHLMRQNQLCGNCVNKRDSSNFIPERFMTYLTRVQAPARCIEE